MLRDADIDPVAALAGKRRCDLGYGNQGRAQALNLHDSGIDVVVGLRGAPEARSKLKQRVWRCAARRAVAPPASSCCSRQTRSMAHSIARSNPICAPGRRSVSVTDSRSASASFIPRPDLDVFLDAPEGPGNGAPVALSAGQGHDRPMGGRAGCHRARAPRSLSLTAAIGCGRAGLIASSFAEEAEADLFNEQAVVWAACPSC